MLKWPNDLLLSGKKLGGILLERNADRVILGFGVNLATAPDVPDRPAASLSGIIEPQAFAPLLAASFSRLLSLWRTSGEALLVQAWLPRAHARGTPLTVHVSETERAEGTFDGLDPDGALRLRRSDGQVAIIHAGDVTITP